MRLRAASENAEPAGVGRVAVGHLDRRPRPLPQAGSRDPGEPNLAAAAFDDDARPRLRDSSTLSAMSTKHLNKYGDRVVALERHERRRFAAPERNACIEDPASGTLDAGDERLDPGPRAMSGARRRHIGGWRMSIVETPEPPYGAVIFTVAAVRENNVADWSFGYGRAVRRSGAR